MQISVLQMAVHLLLELCPKFLTNFISGSCSHRRSADYFMFSVSNGNAFPSVECLSLDEALSGNCTGNATAFMGDDIRFE
jgi:hypothetical protein